jgi:HD-GYP domain-containing protein (c-di-GMP phosphodiesterase class II)
MQGIYAKFDANEVKDPNNGPVLSLLAEHDNVEIMLQTIKKGQIMWISPSDDIDMMEFFYIVEGDLILKNENETIKLGKNDCFYVNGLKEEVLLESGTDLKVLYVASRPIYDNLESFNCDLNELLDKIDKKDLNTIRHSKKVMNVSVKISEKMNFYDTTINDIAVASLFHDVGKCFIPDDILKKTSKLDADEWRYIIRHPSNSKRLLENKFGSKIAKIVEMHHERLDGSGYPYGLSGDQISMEARIIAVADSFDAMTADRGYNQPKTYMEALIDIEDKKKWYDKDIVKILRQLIINNEI